MKVELKRISEETLEKVRLWRNSPEVSKYMYNSHTISAEEHRKWFNRIKTSEDTKFWIIVLDGEPVGSVSLFDIDKKNMRCSWAYYIAEVVARGKGLGKLIELNVLNYVFNVLHLNKLCCEVFTFNQLVIDIHEKYGSKIEGHFKKHIQKDGAFYDIVCMAILHEEWDKIKDSFNVQIIAFE